MASLSKSEITALSVEERLDLIGKIWETLENEPHTSVDRSHQLILEERLATYDPTREDLSPLDEISKRLRAR